jgi:hypothetical protein
VAAAGKNNHRFIRVAGQISGHALRHGLIPHQLRFPEMFEVATRWLGVLVKDLLNAFAVGLIGFIDLSRQLFAQRRLQSFEPNLRNFLRQFARGVQSYDGNAVFSGEAENRAIQPEIESPSVEIFGPLEKFPLVDFAGHISVQIRLKWALDKLHADRPSVGIPLIEPTDDFQFREMLIVSVVLFANKNGARGRYV